MFYYDVDEDIQLRILHVHHADIMFALIEKDRSYLRNWLPWVDGTRSVEDAKTFIQFALQKFVANNGFTAAIFYKGEFAGCVGLDAMNWSNKEASIGGWLGSEFQGKGIMTRSCRVIMNHLFNDLGMNRVEMRVADLNHRSRAIPERLGLTLEGIVKDDEWLNDRFVDTVVYGISREVH